MKIIQSSASGRMKYFSQKGAYLTSFGAFEHLKARIIRYKVFRPY
jgi:hypothetical protein